MEKLTTKQADTLNDLIKINNDRMAGYERAIDYLNDGNEPLKALLSDCIDQSLAFKMQLKELLHDADEKVEDGTTLDGKIYRAWMDVKAAFTGGGPKESWKIVRSAKKLPKSLMTMLWMNSFPKKSGWYE